MDENPNVGAQARQIISSLTSAYLTALQVAAEETQVQLHFAGVQLRMEALQSLLGDFQKAKARILKDRESAEGDPVLLAASDAALAAVAANEAALLVRMGVPREVAERACLRVIPSHSPESDNDRCLPTPELARQKRKA